MLGLLRKVLYQKRWFMLGWGLGFIAMAMFMILLYPSLKASNLDQLLQSLSPALQKVSGGAQAFHDINAYIGGDVFALRMPLLAIIMSIVLFVGLFVGDERRGLLTTQLSLPLSRSRIYVVKLVAALLIMAVTTVMMIGGLFLAASFIGESVDTVLVLKHVLGCVLIGLDFGSVVLVFGAGFGLRGLATAVATLLAFVSYLVSSMVAIASSLETVEKFSLFHYYQNPSPVSLAHAALLGGFAAVCAVIGIVGFSRRDVG